MIRFIWTALVIVPSTLYYGARILWTARWGKNKEALEWFPRGWTRSILWAAGVKVVLENEEVIDPDRPQILVANHSSWFDVAAIAAYLPGKYRFVAKQELAKVPVFGPAWQASGHIAIDRHNREAAIQSLAVARKKLEEERPTVIMFPEGTRSADGKLKRFKKGAFLLAIQTGVEIVPAAVVGAYEVMNKRSWLIRSGTVTVRFGTPIKVQGLSVEDRDDLIQQARSQVLEMQGATDKD